MVQYICHGFPVSLDQLSVFSPFFVCAGMAIFFNLGAEGTYGTMYKIVPETTKDFANKKTCFKVPGMNGAEVMPQTILPNASLYSVSRKL